MSKGIDHETIYDNYIRKAVEDAVMGAGASEVLIIEEPMAAAIGAGLPVQEAAGNMIVDIGGGTTEIAVISLGGVVSWKSLKLAGDKFDEAIIQYARDKFNILLGERSAENIKIQIASVMARRSGWSCDLEVSSRMIAACCSGMWVVIFITIPSSLQQRDPLHLCLP